MLCLTGLLQGVEMWVCGKILAAFFFWIPSTHKRLMQYFLNSLVGKRQPVIQNRAWSPFYLPNHNLPLKLKILVSPSEKIEGAVSQYIYLIGIMKIKSSLRGWKLQPHPNGKRYPDCPTSLSTVRQVTPDFFPFVGKHVHIPLVIRCVVIEQGEPVKTVLPIQIV